MGIWPLPTQETSERRIRRGWPWGCPEEAGKLGAEDGEARGTGAALGLVACCGNGAGGNCGWPLVVLPPMSNGASEMGDCAWRDGRGGRWGRRFAGEGAHRLPRFLGGSPELPWDCRREFGDAEEPRSTAAGSGTAGRGCWLPSPNVGAPQGRVPGTGEPLAAGLVMRSAGHGCHGGEGCWIGGVPGLSSFRDERGGWSGPLTAGGEEDSLPLALEEQDLPLPVAGGRRGSFRCLPPVARLDLKVAARKSRCRSVGGGPGRSVAGFERKLRGGRFVASATGCWFRSRREWMAAAGDGLPPLGGGFIVELGDAGGRGSPGKWRELSWNPRTPRRRGRRR
ncbi:hypothetical protein MLD38_034381 [Melastoma candidum]|uniref:Uncharacterized protein n=1 Tax=Melastoma candidum TaxID=119954 RepID=A0ACB9M9V4_9MYRT|nr:hypothetical protein MLD38_034381 [Melastoma candidum]